MLPPPGFEPSVRAEAKRCSPQCGPLGDRRDERGLPQATGAPSGRRLYETQAPHWFFTVGGSIWEGSWEGTQTFDGLKMEKKTGTFSWFIPGGTQRQTKGVQMKNRTLFQLLGRLPRG